MPGDNLFPKHISQSEQQCQRTYFTDTSAVLSDKQIQRIGYLAQSACIAMNSLFHQCQRSSTGGSVHIRSQLPHYRPCCHLHRERKQQEYTSRQCRVERVASQTTERHLAYTDCEQCAQNDNPDR